MLIQTDDKLIYNLIKQAVSEAINERFDELKLNILPYVDDTEMDTIDSIFVHPDNYKNQEFEEVVL